MSQPRRYCRTLALAGCLPYVAWCVLGQWLHGLIGCCEAQSHLHAAAVHSCAHVHQHSHVHCESPPDDGPRFAESRANHVHGCPICDFAGQAQSVDVGPQRSVDLAAGALAPLPVAARLSYLISADHPGRGPPRA